MGAWSKPRAPNMEALYFSASPYHVDKSNSLSISYIARTGNIFKSDRLGQFHSLSCWVHRVKITHSSPIMK